MDVVESEEMLDSVGAMVGGSHANGPATLRPRHAAHRTHFQGPPLVEADYRSTRRAGAVESADEFFLRSKCGSLDVF